MSGFQALLIDQGKKLWEEGLHRVRITHSTVTREHVWTAVRRTRDVRLRERSHAIVLLRDGQSCPEVAPWRYRDEETLRAWVHARNDAGRRGWARATSPGRPT